MGYFLVTGQRVFEGRNVVEVCSHHLHSRPTPPAERLGRSVPDTLSSLLLACLEKEPLNRPASARAVVSALDPCHDVTPWTEDQARTWWSTQRPRTRGPQALDGLSSVGTLSFVRRGGVAPEA